MISAQYVDGLELRIKELEAKLAAITEDLDNWQRQSSDNWTSAVKNGLLLAAMTQTRDYIKGRSVSWERDAVLLSEKLATMTQERDHWREANRTSLAAGDILKEQLTASKAYAAQLREALEICKKEMQGDKWDAQEK